MIGILKFRWMLNKFNSKLSKLIYQRCIVKYKRIINSNRIKENVVTFIKNIWLIFKMQKIQHEKISKI